MKLLAPILAFASGSHYRGGTYQFTPDNIGYTAVTVTQTWRKGDAGYGGK